MARWINVKQSFDYHWPNRSAVTAFSQANIGDNFVKDEVADFAVGRGYASEGKADAASRSRKGGRARRENTAAKTADTGSATVLDRADDADADRPIDGRSVDHDAG